MGRNVSLGKIWVGEKSLVGKKSLVVEKGWAEEKSWVGVGFRLIV